MVMSTCHMMMSLPVLEYYNNITIATNDYLFRLNSLNFDFFVGLLLSIVVLLLATSPHSDSSNTR